MLLLYLTLLLGITSAVKDDDKKPMYTITAPNTIASRSFYTVEVFIHQAHRPSNVTVELQKPEKGEGHYHTFDPLSAMIRPGEGKSFRFKTKLLKSDSYTLRVIGTQGLKFEDSVIIPVNAKKATVLIQTDKGLYQARQTVNFRIIILDTLLMPLISFLHVNIYDGRSNLIKQFAQNTTQKGVFSNSLELSDNPVLGTWKIEVVNEDTVTTVQTFSVQEYVLPTFEVTLRTQPTYVTFNQSDVLVIVEAKYTHGQAVKGKVTLQIRDEYCTYNFVEKCDAKIFTSEKKNIVDEVSIPVNFVKDLALPENVYGFGFRNFKIEATVSEDLTLIERNSSTSITMHKDPIKVELLPAGSFKPGLNFTQMIKVGYHDDTPLLNGVGNVNITVQYSSAHDDSVSYSLPMTKTGILKLDVNVSKKATSLSFQANYNGVTGYASVPKAASSGNFEYIKLTQITPVAEVDKYMQLSIESTQNLDSRLILLVVARGDINYVKTFPPSDHSTQLVQFKIHETMAPVMTVLVYYVTNCANLVVDAISIEVQGLFRTPVSIKLKHNTTEPGKDIVVEIKTRPKSFVGILAVDQSVLLLNKGNDISEQKVLDDLAQYEMSRSYFYNPLIVDKNSAFPHPWSSATNSLQVFRDGGLVIKTNFLEDVDSFPVPYAAGIAMDKGVADNQADARDAQIDTSDTDDVNHVRKSFPETLLWIDSETNPAGKYTIHKKAPDSITSYIVTAIAINEKTGFGLAYPAKMTIFKKFFSTLNLPPCIKREEFVSIQVLTFNYYDHAVKGTVTIHNNNQTYKFVENQKEVEDTTKHGLVNIPPKEGYVTTFIISPKKLGLIELKITTTGKYGSDTLIKQLFVKPEGIERTINKPNLVDLSGMVQTFSKTVPVEFPANAVKESQKLSVSVIGSILGASIRNLDKLLTLPQGCGEQNMLNFAPDVVIAKLLKELTTVPDDLQNNVTTFLGKGYQNQLTYQRRDGSFSAFGNKDSNASTWLTAFVAKYFHLAEAFTTVDKKVIDNALEFLAKQQTAEGNFIEGGNIIHKTIQGGSAQGVALTAYVLSTLITVKNPKYDPNIKSATDYLAKQDPAKMGLYDLIITAHALHNANNPKKDAFLKAITAKAISKDNEKHWDIPDDAKTGKISRSLSIEASAYACLIHLSRNELESAIPIIRWLIAQQNVQGGFETTQDTVLAIEALAAAASKLQNKEGASITIKITAGDATHEMKVDAINSFLLRSTELPATAKEVTITANGNGVAVVQVSYTYNDNNPVTTAAPAFSGTVKTISNVTNNRSFDVEVCAKKQQSEAVNNMIIMEISMATGSIVNKHALPQASSENQVNAVRKVETKEADTRVVLYFDAMSEVCINVSATQTHIVFNTKPAFVKMYDYYEPDKCGEIQYNAPAIK